MPRTETPIASADHPAPQAAPQSGADASEVECLASAYGSRIAAALRAEHGTSTDQAAGPSDPH